MPGPRGGKSRTSHWRSKKRKMEKAIGKKYQNIQFSTEESSSEESREAEEDGDVLPQDTDLDATGLSPDVPHGENLVQPGPVAPLQDIASTSCNSQVDSDDSTNSSSDAESSDDSTDSSSDAESYEAAYLLENEEDNLSDPDEAEPNQDERHPDGPGPNGPDPDGSDPDEPDGDGDNDVLDSDDSEDNDRENFDLNDPTLNAALHVGRLHTKKEALLLQIGLSVRHSWDYESLINNMKAINLSLGRNNLPTNKKQLWRILNRNSAGIHYHAYCSECSHYLGRKNRLVPPVVCGGCGIENDINRLHCFVTLSVKKQLEIFLSKPGTFQLLQYRQTRVKRHEGAIEDVFDSERYQNMMRQGGILSNNLNFSYILNADGFVKSTTARIKMWPVLLRLNELPPNHRQKHMFLAGVWVGRKQPNPITFLGPIVRHLNRLAVEGVNWTPDNGDVMVNSKFVPFGFTADAEGRALLLNMQRWNGAFGCTFCLYETVDQKYPVPEEGHPWPANRTDAGMRQDMVADPGNEDHFRGHKGVTELRNLEYFDLRASNTMDDLHPIYIGVTKFHTELLLNLPGNAEARVRAIDHRLRQIDTPSCISRKPMPISKRGKYHGTEWRNWLLYYGPVCLQDQIPANHLRHFKMLSHGIYLLSQDSIMPEDTDYAEQLLETYVRLFQELHGRRNMRYNIHVLLHLVRSVRENGGLWCYSTFNFESWNHRLLLFVTSPKDSMMQMITRHLLCALVYRSAYDEDIDETIREFLQSLLFKGHRNAHTAGNAHLLGNSRNRQPTMEEANLLQREGFPVQPVLRMYDRVIAGGAEYRVPQFNPGGLSNNSLLYTSNNTFCRVQSIAICTDRDGEDKCILFVDEFDIVRTLNVARHIAEVREGQELPHVIRAETIVSPAVRMVRAGVVYLVPLPTVHEID